ncbi:MAG: DUF4391 domain-containing protein [Bacteroidales bacterium]|nr:DUF4391 domain-containing protein [Bacteroidales bacterium]
MLGLPQSTAIKRPLPKALLFKRFDWTPSQRNRFDDEVSRLDVMNCISPQTVPAIVAGNEVKEIFVVEVQLKSREFDTKAIELLAKNIQQRIVYVLRYEEEATLAVYHTKLLMTERTRRIASLPIVGLNLDAVLENIVSSIGDFSVDQDKSLTEQIRIDEERNKMLRQIATLERQMNATKQPRRKRELFVELQKLKAMHNA